MARTRRNTAKLTKMRRDELEQPANDVTSEHDGIRLFINPGATQTPTEGLKVAGRVGRESLDIVAEGEEAWCKANRNDG